MLCVFYNKKSKKKSITILSLWKSEKKKILFSHKLVIQLGIAFILIHTWRGKFTKNTLKGKESLRSSQEERKNGDENRRVKVKENQLPIG